jgi:hypothetical protein
MEFEIDDMVYDPGDDLPPLLKRILDVVENMPDGKLYSTARLAQETGCSKDTILSHTAHPALDKYKIKHKGNKNVYGNEKTIEAFLEQFDG